MSEAAGAAPIFRVGPGGWLLRYAALLRNAWLIDVQYRAAILIWLVWGLVEPLISLSLWWSIAGTGEVAGYDRAGFARYFFAILLVNQMTMAWDAWYLDHWIRRGELNFRLVRPISPVHEAVAENLAYKARAATIVAVAWGVTAIFWPAVRLPFEPARWAAAALAVLMAGVLRFFNGYATGLLAFWTTRATALVQLQYGVSMFLAGRLAPLALLPPAVATLATWTWYPWMLAFPAEIVTGDVELGSELLQGLAAQAIWVLGWWLLYRLAWNRGLRQYGAVGG